MALGRWHNGNEPPSYGERMRLCKTFLESRSESILPAEPRSHPCRLQAEDEFVVTKTLGIRTSLTRRQHPSRFWSRCSCNSSKSRCLTTSHHRILPRMCTLTLNVLLIVLIRSNHNNYHKLHDCVHRSRPRSQSQSYGLLRTLQIPKALLRGTSTFTWTRLELFDSCSPSLRHTGYVLCVQGRRPGCGS